MSKSAGIEPGGRVRITAEGVYVGNLGVIFDGAEWVETAFVAGEVAAETFKVERIDTPLAVGDDIWPKHNRAGVATRRVLAAFERDGQSWIVFNSFVDGLPTAQGACYYERAPI